MAADFSKIGKSNSRKGKTYERRVAKLLTDWSGTTFRRRRVEGRDSTVIDRESTSDVISVGKMSRFSIEAKSRAGFSLDALMASPVSCVFTSWWLQTCYDTQLLMEHFKQDFYPLLFFKPHSNFDWVAISQKPFKLQLLKPKSGKEVDDIWFASLKFDAYDLLEPIQYNVIQTKKKENFKYVSIAPQSFYMCRWNDFANNVDPRGFFIPDYGAGNPPLASLR